jgi:hypothetical protein
MIVPGAGAGSHDAGKDKVVEAIMEAIAGDYASDKAVRLAMDKVDDFEVLPLHRDFVIGQAAERAYMALVGQMSEALGRGEEVKISGFATFRKREKKDYFGNRTLAAGGGPVLDGMRVVEVEVSAVATDGTGFPLDKKSWGEYREPLPRIDLKTKFEVVEVLWMAGEYQGYSQIYRAVPGRVKVNFGEPVNAVCSAGGERLERVRVGVRECQIRWPGGPAVWDSKPEIVESLGMVSGPLEEPERVDLTAADYAEFRWEKMQTDQILAAFASDIDGKPKRVKFAEVVDDSGLSWWVMVERISPGEVWARFGDGTPGSGPGGFYSQRDYWLGRGFVFPVVPANPYGPRQDDVEAVFSGAVWAELND